MVDGRRKRESIIMRQVYIRHVLYAAEQTRKVVVCIDAPGQQMARCRY